MNQNEASRQIVDAAMKVHSALGPGLLESAYQACLGYELHERGLRSEREVGMPLRYGGVALEVGYRIDLLVEQCVVVELKSVEKILPIHEAQLLCYLRLSKCRLGLLFNFNVVHLKDGIKRMANNL
jgi:GxxExxY protein